MSSLFYVPPSTEYFNEMKEAALEVWGEYDDTFGYATEKQNYVRNILNEGSGFMSIWQMFDINNQRCLLQIKRRIL